MPPELLLNALLVAFGLVAVLIANLPRLKRELAAQEFWGRVALIAICAGGLALIFMYWIAYFTPVAEFMWVNFGPGNDGDEGDFEWVLFWTMIVPVVVVVVAFVIGLAVWRRRGVSVPR